MSSANLTNAGSSKNLSHRPSSLPHLESLDRILKIPVVDATWQHTQSVYGKVKEYNIALQWTFRTAEDVLHRAVSFSTPLIQKFDRPLQVVDQTLVKGIAKLEETAPIIKEQPQQIYNQARTKILDSVKPYTEKVYNLHSASNKKVASLKVISWKKANEVLATQYGTIAITGVDTTALMAERFLDYFFPRDALDAEEDAALAAVSDDPVLHTIQIVGRLSNKIARRIYRVILQHIRSLRKEDVREYLAALFTVLHVAQYVRFIVDFRDTDPMADDGSSDCEAAAAAVLDVVTEAVRASSMKAKSESVA